MVLAGITILVWLQAGVVYWVSSQADRGYHQSVEDQADQVFESIMRSVRNAEPK